MHSELLKERPHLCSPLLQKLIRRKLFLLASLGIAGLAPSPGDHALAASQVAEVPAWLSAHVGDEEGQISRVVLERARALYLRKVSEGAVKNPCYFAMDATRPSDLGENRLGQRFYIICEADRSFRAVSAGHGSGRDLKGFADFSNGRQCARNFGSALDSLLTTGGSYVTAETKTSFKGYFRASMQPDTAFTRSFVQFDGEGETANARKRAIGGHAAQILKGLCLRKNPDSPYANEDGYVPVGTLVDYAAGRSNGCTSWSASDARQIMSMIEDNPTSLYIYPESRDIDAVARALKAGGSPSRAGLYWNAACLKQIGVPRFWSAAELGPIIARYQASHPPPPARPLPICKGQ